MKANFYWQLENKSGRQIIKKKVRIQKMQTAVFALTSALPARFIY
jgi:hypothetical protein